MTVSWSEEIDAVLGGDLTAALTYLTPAGGRSRPRSPPFALRDRQAGWVGWLREYYAMRVPVLAHLDRIMAWPDLQWRQPDSLHGGLCQVGARGRPVP